VKIREVLSRRNDLSTFVVHLTRDIVETDSEGQPVWIPAEQSLRWIIEGRALRAVTPMGWAKALDDTGDPAKQSQRVICFSEAPLEHTYSLVAEIEDRARDIELRPYGLALPKLVARRLGVNPVWYVDMTGGTGSHDWDIVHALDRLRDGLVADDIAGRSDFHSHDLAQLFPFVEAMGSWPGRNPKEFWWEREWRCRGDLSLAPIWSKIIWLCPAASHTEFRRRVNDATPSGETASRVFIDPTWGLEEIIASLAGLPDEDVSVFAAAV
jgi:hypothetical protein